MTFQPVLPAVVIVLAVLAVLAVVGWTLARTPSARPLWAMRAVLVLACGMLLLRPGVPGGTAETLATDVDVLLVVDTSASIVAEDWDGDRPRLDGVRSDIADIVARYPGARFALLTFDSDAAVRVPLTTDATALTSSLAVLRPEATSRSGGSSVGAAAGVLEETLAAAEEVSPDRARMVFYFGDGEQTAATPPDSFGGSAGDVDGGAVFGYGTEQGGPMRVTEPGIDQSGDYIEYQGERALSVIDPATLQAIADELGVPYLHRDADSAPELPPAPATTTAASGSTESVVELTWVVALVVAVLLAVELALAVAGVLRTARVRRPDAGRAGA